MTDVDMGHPSHNVLICPGTVIGISSIRTMNAFKFSIMVHHLMNTSLFRPHFVEGAYVMFCLLPTRSHGGASSGLIRHCSDLRVRKVHMMCFACCHRA